MKVTKITPISWKDNVYKVSFSRVFQRKHKTYNGGSKVRKWCKDKLKLPRNKIRIMVTSKKIVKVRLGFILNQNREASLEDSAPIEGFLLVWGFNGELRWFRGGCGWWRRSLECWKWFWKKEGEGNGIFPRLHEKQSLKHSSACAREKGSISNTPDMIQTKFQEDPTVNEGRSAILARQL